MRTDGSDLPQAVALSSVRTTRVRISWSKPLSICRQIREGAPEELNLVAGSTRICPLVVALRTIVVLGEADPVRR